MAQTIYTPDGKMHVLQGSTTPLSLIREYAGEELAVWAEEQAELAQTYLSYTEETEN